jgi:hypothetical protein
MGTIIMALSLVFCAPVQMPQTTPTVSMSDYQEAQIEWYLYYGEWAPAPSDTDSDTKATKKGSTKEKASK